MPIQQVTHINSSADSVGPPLDPVNLLAGLASAENREAPSFFERNPKLITEEAEKLQAEAQRGYNGLDDAGRLEQASMWKVASNALIAKDKPHAALLGYLAALWYLRRPSSFPMCVAHALSSAKEKEARYTTTGLQTVAAWLNATTSDGDASDAQAAALRASLHLNAAMAALKLSQWPAARAACERVLAVDDGNVKALYRLAKAHEGEGDLVAGLSALALLLKVEPQNGDARRLHEALRARQAEEKDKFKRMFVTTAADAAAGGSDRKDDV